MNAQKSTRPDSPSWVARKDGKCLAVFLGSLGHNQLTVQRAAKKMGADSIEGPGFGKDERKEAA